MVSGDTTRVCSRRSMLGGICAGTMTLLIAACTKAKPAAGAQPTGSASLQTMDSVEVSVASPVPLVTVPSPSLIRDVTSFGAVGDGRTDDTAAIRTALGALSSGQALRFPDGHTFCHSDVLTVRTAGIQLLGPGTLLATVEGRSALKVEAGGVVVDGLQLGVQATTRRWSTPDQHKLFFGQVDGVIARNVVITGSAAAGLFCLGTSNFVLQDVRVSDTRADGIHMTYGSHDGNVRAPVISRSGDDGVAVVSYLDDKVICRNITVIAPKVHTTTGGRGISVVGGEVITYLDVDISGSSAAAVYLACEGGDSVTAATRGVQVRNGTITGANTNSAIDHGAVLVYSGRAAGGISNVVVSGLQISDTRSSASRQIGVIADADSPVTGVRFVDLQLSSAPTPYQGNAPQGSFELDGVTAAGRTVRA